MLPIFGLQHRRGRAERCKTNWVPRFLTAGFKKCGYKPHHPPGCSDFQSLKKSAVTNRTTRLFRKLLYQSDILMEKKEAYRHILPHFQQPGRAYFVTWNLKDAVPPKALERYTRQLEALGAAISNRGNNMRLKTASPEIEKLKQEYCLVRKKYIKAYDDLLDAARNPSVDLSQTENTAILIQAFKFWEEKKLKNLAFTIMPNHVHWVFQVLEKDQDGNPVYLQDILHSVKRFSSNQINKAENREGTLWQKESFDTTIRDEKHLYYAIRYTLQNPEKAGLVTDWRNWDGTWVQRFLTAEL